MPHRCWALDEIVRAITANLVASEAKSSAVSLASCSKSLEESALGEVWRHLSSLAPLVKCFPPDIWETRDEKLVSTWANSADTTCWSNRFLIVFQEGPTA